MATKDRVGKNLPASGQKKTSKATTKQPSKTKAPPKAERENNPLQDVVYVPPKPFVRNRLLLRLATVVAIVLALVLAMSVFFRVGKVEVSGLDQYTAWDIQQASGIEIGDSLFSLSLPGAAARIEDMDYIKEVRIGIKLPNTVIIDVVEIRVSYAMKDQDNTWWLLDSKGRVVDKASESALETATKILGVHLLNPKKGQQCEVQETTVPEVDENGNTIPAITDAHRLNLALMIADSLENNGIIGTAASIDVHDVSDIQYWYGQQYQVKLGDESQLEYKISVSKSTIDSLNEESHNSGVLDVSFTVLEDQVHYIPFQ